MSKHKSCILAAAIVLVHTTFLRGQAKPTRLTFDVASVKPAKPSEAGPSIEVLPGGREYFAQNAPLKLIISLMYKIPMRQITGGPAWIDSDLWNINAKVADSYNLDDLHTMFQNLLAEVFKLKFHKETRTGPVYALMVDKSGSKMKVNESPPDYEAPIVGAIEGFVGTRVSMQYLCWWLGQILERDERAVIDKTGLDKNYDFKLVFSPELPPNFSRENLPPGFFDHPSIFDALKQELGLKLEAQKGPVEYYVIDRVERPVSN
jgi:uncharacterized protein (TIGR03435 family)